MTTANYDNAKSKALDLLRLYDIQEPIVPVFDIAKQEGLKISFFTPESAELKEISGILQEDTKTIFINSSDSPQRQVFTVAHELGHWTMKHKRKDEVLYRMSSIITKDPQEQEANCFASHLLVPKEFLEKKINEFSLNINDTAILAKLFGVSEEMIQYRIKSFSYE
ncbi:ImmA/IrrE family metallo-endopeptidase [Candidatus Peregrinibacteria bacterium]|nr:MAG: ImmA/IrrE family metallo-endopeptidase [Candidatus Peregrinibacteria bacterium]